MYKLRHSHDQKTDKRKRNESITRELTNRTLKRPRRKKKKGRGETIKNRLTSIRIRVPGKSKRKARQRKGPYDRNCVPHEKKPKKTNIVQGI